MAWLTRLQGQIVGLDTAPLIYFIEENSIYLERVWFFITNDTRLPAISGLEILIVDKL